MSGREQPWSEVYEVDVGLEPAPREAAPAASFERDSLVWALGKLSECALRHFLREAHSVARYARWLSDEAPALAGASGAEEGLLLVGLELGKDGTLTLKARPSRGQFLLLVEHRQFEAVVAVAHHSLNPRRQLDGVCLAHFEGDAALGTRWALGLNAWLRRRWQTPRGADSERLSAPN